jgi:hypothetical protein
MKIYFLYGFKFNILDLMIVIISKTVVLHKRLFRNKIIGNNSFKKYKNTEGSALNQIVQNPHQTRPT